VEEKMSRVVHFEVPVDNPERAVRFFNQVFDWKLDKYPGGPDYWLATTGAPEQMGINGALTRRSAPQTVMTNTIGVESLDDTIKKIKENGGTIITEKQTVPNIGYVIYFRDSGNNVWGLIQPIMPSK
jgi:uncharacterized protein